MAREDVEMLPDGESGFDGGSDDEFDLNNLVINFSDKEAASEAREFVALPSGKYHVKITEVEIKKSTSQKNYGKPYYALTMTVQDGPFANRKLWGNVMLWEGAAYSLVQLMKACGRRPGVDPIPRPEDLLTRSIMVIAVKKVDKYKIDQGEWDASSGEPKPFKTEVSGYLPFTGQASSSVAMGQPVASREDSLLP